MKRDVLTQTKMRKVGALMAEDRLGEALAIAEPLARSKRGDMRIRVLLASIYRQIGHYGEAEEHCRQVLAQNPRFAEAHQVLGEALQCQGNLDGAVDCYQAALRLKPELFDIHYLLGDALREQGLLNDAVEHYRAVLAVDPDHVPTLCNLGGTLGGLSRFDEAVPLLNKANRLQPGCAPILCNMARVLILQGRAREAEACCREAIAADPRAVDALAMLADLLEKSSRLEEVDALLEQGLALAPDHVGLNFAAARLARRERRHQDGIAIAERALSFNPPADSRGELHFLLGQLYDHLNDPQHAFAHFMAGNRLNSTACAGQAGQTYPERIAHLRDQFRATLPALADRHPDPAANAETSPVFLVGFPRSGTTLLEQILDSHPQLQTLSERPTVSAMQGRYDALVARRPAAASGLTEADILELRGAYFHEAGKYLKREPGRMLVDKMPLNLAAAYLIWRVFPDAKFILALRHPCDVCLSCFMQNFTLNDAMDTFTSLEATAGAYAAVMELWQEYAATLQLQYHPLRYEDLVEDMESEARRLLEFLDIQWSPAVLGHVEHAKNRGTIGTPSYHQVTQPIYKKAKYRWKRYARELEPVMGTLQPFMERFGYDEPDGCPEGNSTSG